MSRSQPAIQLKNTLTVVKLGLILCLSFFGARAQDAMQGSCDEVRPSDPRVALDAQASATTIAGRLALAGRLRTTSLGRHGGRARAQRVSSSKTGARSFTPTRAAGPFYVRGQRARRLGVVEARSARARRVSRSGPPGLRLTLQRRLRGASSPPTCLTRTTDVAKPANENAPPAPDRPRRRRAHRPAAGESTSCGHDGAASRRNQRQRQDRPPSRPATLLEIVVGRERVRIIVHPVP